MVDYVSVFKTLLILFCVPVVMIAVSVRSIILIKKKRYIEGLRLWGTMLLCVGCLLLFIFGAKYLQ